MLLRNKQAIANQTKPSQASRKAIFVTVEMKALAPADIVSTHIRQPVWYNPRGEH